MQVSAWIMVAIAMAGLPLAATARPDASAADIRGALGATAYRRADADLNGDGRKEVFAYATDQTYCGSGGCTLLVLSPQGRGYRVVLRSTVTQLPVSVLSTSTRGWRDIGVTVAGGGAIHAYMARMKFNGRRYPSNPTVPPALPVKYATGKILIHD